MKKLDTVKDHLTETQEEIENIDSFYEGLQYAHLSESEKTAILLSIFERNIQNEKKKLEKSNKQKYLPRERKIGTIKEENVDKLKEASKTLENYFQIKLTYPQDSKKISRVEKNRFLFAEI